MSTQSLAPQDRNTCPNGKTYFACVSSSFHGCCSKDPCALGFCPDKLNFNRDPRDPAGEEPTETTLFPPPASKSEEKKNQETATETMTDDKSKSGRETPPPLPPTNTMTTMTDSGITHTIPNNSVVTVILHTTITTKRPSSNASLTDSALPTDASLGTSIDANGVTATGPVSPVETGAGASSDAAAGGFSTAAIIGVAVGGVVLIAILGVLAMFVRRRRRERDDDASEVYSSGFTEENGPGRREELPEEKHYPPPVSTHTTGTQGSSDPFAPFGGRADDPYRPHSGTFEMDGTSVAPVELPVHDSCHVSGQNASANLKMAPAPRLDPVQEGAVTPADPRANLNSVQTEGGKPAFINHWNQYRNLGQSDQS